MSKIENFVSTFSYVSANYPVSFLETVYLNTKPTLAAISSTIVRDIIKNQGNVSHFLASGVQL